MSKIKINSITDAEFQDLQGPIEPSKQKKSTTVNKACIILSIWSMILSIIGSGIICAIISVALVATFRLYKNLKKSSAKWAVYLTATAVFVNIVMAILLAL